jgi:hypothetical protein
MTDKSKLARVAAGAAPAFASYIGNYVTLPSTMARRFFDARMEKAQMRLAPANWMGAARRSSCVGRD